MSDALGPLRGNFQSDLQRRVFDRKVQEIKWLVQCGLGVDDSRWQQHRFDAFLSLPLAHLLTWLQHHAIQNYHSMEARIPGGALCAQPPWIKRPYEDGYVLDLPTILRPTDAPLEVASGPSLLRFFLVPLGESVCQATGQYRSSIAFPWFSDTLRAMARAWPQAGEAVEDYLNTPVSLPPGETGQAGDNAPIGPPRTDQELSPLPESLRGRLRQIAALLREGKAPREVGNLLHIETVTVYKRMGDIRRICGEGVIPRFDRPGYGEDW